jgi:uncharacterized membrane protein YeaQ/YmgE (transglycosylase-associated protein family)
MTTESWLVMLAIGAFAGWLAGLFLRGSGYGIIGNIIVGLLGALLGTWLLRVANISLHLGNALLERIIIAVAGAVLLMFIISLLRPRSLKERTTGFFRRARS